MSIHCLPWVWGSVLFPGERSCGTKTGCKIYTASCFHRKSGRPDIEPYGFASLEKPARIRFSCRRNQAAARGTPWTEQEIEAIVEDYFDMLEIELAGGAVVKAEHNRTGCRRLAGTISPARFAGSQMKTATVPVTTYCRSQGGAKSAGSKSRPQTAPPQRLSGSPRMSDEFRKNDRMCSALPAYMTFCEHLQPSG